MESVSIIIPVYRQARFLRRAVQSVLDQDYGNFEVVVVDDGSGDASSTVALEAQSLDPRVRTIVRRRNGGLGRARNTGLAEARGDYVGFLDSDDYLLPGSLTSRMTALRDNTDPDVVGAYGDWIHVQEHVDLPPEVRAPRSGLPVIDASVYTGFNSFIVTSPLVDRVAAVEAGGFGAGLPMLEDWVLWLRMLERGGRFIPVEHVVCVYRQRPGSMLRSRGVTLPATARTMNDWWLSRGRHLSDGGRARAWLDGKPALGFHRRNWTAASSEGLDLFRRVTSASGPDDADVAPAESMVAALEQGPAAVSDEATDLDRGTRAAGVATLVDTDRHDQQFDVVLVPTDIEGALEAGVIASHLAAADVHVAIGVADRHRLVGLWPALSAGVPVTPLDSVRCDAAKFVVWSTEDAVVVRLARLHGRNRVFARPTGVGVFHVMRRGGQLRFRAPTRLLLRTRLEVAEYGDRPHAVIPSGSHHHPSVRRADGASCVVLVPDDALRLPAIDGWAASAVRTVSSVRSDLRIMGSQRAADRLQQLRVEAVDLDSLAGEVVLPLSNAVTLVESLGGTAVVFDPTVDRDGMSTAWLAGLQLCSDEEELADALESAPTDTEPAIGTVAPSDQPRDEWAAAFVDALVVD